MRRLLVLLLFLFALELSFSDAKDNILEDAYFDVSGVWVDYGHLKSEPLWSYSGSFSWGKLENYDPFMGAVIDIGSKDGKVYEFQFKAIEKQDDTYVILLKSLREKLYIQVIAENQISFVSKPDSITGNLPLERKSGPLREFIEENGTMLNDVSLYILPSFESKIVGNLTRRFSVQLTQKTIRDELVTEYTEWYKVKGESGIEGWTPAFNIEICNDK